MKVALIETSSLRYRENPFSQMDRVLEPLAIEYIGAHLQALGHEVRLFQQIRQTNGELLESILSTAPDLVGFSCMTYSYPETLDLAESMKARAPDIQTMLGGYHVIGMDTAPKCFDFVIKGEGEIATERVTDFILGKVDIQDIPGLLFARGVRWDIPPKRIDLSCTRIEAPLRLPRDAFHSLSIGENLPDTRIACVVAGRGCPYRCDFCCTPQIFPGKRMLRPVEDVVSEIIALRDEMGVNNINLRDETFTPHKEYVRAFCEEMIKRKANVSWRAFANIGNVNRELLQLMSDAGCHMLFYGIEASDSETLKMRRKNFSNRTDRIAEDIRATQSVGIYVRAGFIVGHETDTRESFIHHEAYLKELCPDELYISFLTPFPGTPLFQSIHNSGRLLTTDLQLYDCEHPIVDIGIPAEELVKLRQQLYIGFYSSHEWTAHVKEYVRRDPARLEEISIFTAHVAHRLGIPDVFKDESTHGLECNG
jgi:radical SAM superfamily enzyme YgiQ (UPF0313 family)